MTRDQLRAEFEKNEKEMRDKISKFYLSDNWENVRNCPFCGNGKKSLFLNGNGNHTGSVFWISCDTSDFGCGATGPEAATPEEAASKWNGKQNGQWIPTEYDSYADGNPVYDAYECSECGHEHSGTVDTLTAYCPDCGAKMGVDEIQSEEVIKNAPDQTT